MERAKYNSSLHPEYHVGYTIAGDFGSPKVLYAMYASGMEAPHWRCQSPSLYVSNLGDDMVRVSSWLLREV